MAGEIQIDATGMNNMIRALKRYNNVQTRQVVRAVTGEILNLAAKKTGKSTAAAVDDAVLRHFRKPHEVPGVGFVGITKAGKVWVNIVRWGPPLKKRWRLLNESGQLKTLATKYKTRGGKTKKVKSEDKAMINRVISEANKWKIKEAKYRKSLIGMSQATWYQIMRGLKLKIPANAPKKASSMKLPPAAKSAIKTWEVTSSRDNYSINIKNAVQACLSPKKGRLTKKGNLTGNLSGITAFELAFNGKVKEFERAARKDVKEFAKKFADRNGFIVK